MNLPRLAGACVACLLAAAGAGSLQAFQVSPAQDVGAAPPQAPATPSDAPLFRVFLQDGTALVSYGEFAKVQDRVVFSMPTSASEVAPQLQLVNLPASRVDWERTLAYAETVRESRYLATRAETDYAALNAEVERLLNEALLADSTDRRLAILERARRMLAEWPAAHFQYRREDVQQTITTLDEIIAGFRASSGANTFDLSFVATSPGPRSLPALMPKPTAREAIEQTVAAASATDLPAERLSLLSAAAGALEANRATLPTAWAGPILNTVRARLAKEAAIDRDYQAMGLRMLRLAALRAAQADVRGVQRVIASVHANDELLGSTRPDAVASILANVETYLDTARRLRLERDRWALRAPELRAYQAQVTDPLQQLSRVRPLLEDIKALTGSGPEAIGSILKATIAVRSRVATLAPPDELREVHALIVSAAQLAENAARIRREAALIGSMTRAWDASSAAAGALMLVSRAQSDLQAALRPPQLPQ